MKTKTIFSLLLLLVAFNSACADRTVTRITVVGEDGTPVEGATAGVVYYSQTPSVDAGDHGEGLTDSEGDFVFSGRAYWKAQVGAKKDGYYSSSKEVEVTEPDEHGYAQVVPEIEVTLVLREIRDPVPMAAGRIRKPFPESKGRWGFDLLERDWVSPYGEGKETDIWVSVDFDYESSDNYDLRLTWEFMDGPNGIREFNPVPESEFKSPYTAPEAGYQPTLTWRRARMPNSKTGPGEPRVLIHDDAEGSSARLYPENFYIIRFRSEVDDEGEVEGGYYGKIYSAGTFLVGHREGSTGEMFTGVVYVNPKAGDRNLEPDLDQNLRIDLPRQHQPRFH